MPISKRLVPDFSLVVSHMVLFEMDDFGNSFDLDLVVPAFIFAIEEDGEIVWNANNWGHVRFRDIEVRQINT